MVAFFSCLASHVWLGALVPPKNRTHKTNGTHGTGAHGPGRNAVDSHAGGEWACVGGTGRAIVPALDVGAGWPR